MHLLHVFSSFVVLTGSLTGARVRKTSNRLSHINDASLATPSLVDQVLKQVMTRVQDEHQRDLQELHQVNSNLREQNLQLKNDLQSLSNLVHEHRKALELSLAEDETLQQMKKEQSRMEDRIMILETLADVTPTEQSTRQAALTTASATVDAPLGQGDRTLDTIHCGCALCNDAMWNTIAPPGATADFTCGSRIAYMMGSMSELDACRQIAGVEFPGLCGPACDPDNCQSVSGSVTDTSAQGGTVVSVVPVPAPTSTTTNTAQFVAPDTSTVTTPVVVQSSGGYTPVPTLAPHSPHLTDSTDLYCYPPSTARTTWTGVWNQGFTVQAKSDPGLCGPGDNYFSDSTVSVSSDKKELTLEYKMVNGQWHSSEVRVVLPDAQMPFTYGSYAFSVKNITAYDSVTNQVLSKEMGKDLVLGFFTWDDTEIYDVHENFNHEVDVEISKWGLDDNADVQFLVQPWNDGVGSHYYRFNSGSSTSTPDEAGHTYAFTWNPTSITWHTDGNGGVDFEYTTQIAKDLNQPDYVQCLPADLEIRMNVWNFNGALMPSGFSDTTVLEVVIDDFTFTPSGDTGAPLGATCSKHCQCDGFHNGAAMCINAVCTAAA